MGMGMGMARLPDTRRPIRFDFKDFDLVRFGPVLDLAMGMAPAALLLLFLLPLGRPIVAITVHGAR